ncbi:helix-turn-helix transcriptional regulator [Lentilactobacillus sunkii]|nr:helix-turn-helix transcriptional regulator [Lentilactobacillus sunkii]
MMYVTKQLIHFRKMNHYTQDELAKKILVSRQTISHWETGKTYPDIQSLLLLCDLYNISLDQLIHDDVRVFKAQSMLGKTRWLIAGIVLCILLTYFSLISMKWFPLLLSVMALSISTTLGVVLIIILMTQTNFLQINTYQEILKYIKTGEISSKSKMSVQHKIILAILGGFIGIAIGLTLTILIGIYWLGWSF